MALLGASFSPLTASASSRKANGSHSTVTASPTQVPADGTTTSTVFVTLKDAHFKGVSGKAVTLARVSGPGSPTITGPSPALTDVNGLTTFTVKSTTVGTDAFQATDTTDGIVVSQTASVRFTAGPVSASQSTVSASPGSVPDNGVTASTVTVTLKDAGGNTVAGKVVSLAKSVGPGSPSIVGPSPATTGSNGVATFTVTSTTVGTDTFQATDTTDHVTITQTANVTFTLGSVSSGHSTVVASPTNATADGVSTSTITVTLNDATNNPVSGKAVSLAKSAGPGTPTITGPSPATTDANGQTTFTVSSITAGTDTFQANDTTDSVLVTQTASVTFEPGPVGASQSTAVASPLSVPADGTTTSTITVTLNDFNSNPVSGKAVSLALLSGPGSPTISGPTPATTGVNGQVTFTVASTTAGVDTFQATDTTDSTVLSQTPSVTFTALAGDAGQSTVVASPTSVTADGLTTSTVTVTLMDVHGNLVSGKAVTLAKSSGPGTPAITGPSPATTDANGQTTFTVASTTAGIDAFQATDTTDGVIVTQTASVTFVAGETDAGQSTVSANPTSVASDGVTTSTVTVTLLDANGNPVSGNAVTLALLAGPGAPVITGPSPANTDANGQTTFTVASTTAGTDEFQATDTTDSVTITQTASVTFLPGPVDSGASTLAAAPTSVPADGVTTSTLTVTLTDINGNPISGKAVTLAKTAGPGSPAITGPSPATTDVDGTTNFTVVSTTVGTDTFQATDTTDSVVVTQTALVTFTTPTLPTVQSVRSTQQYTLPNSNGTTWVEIDPTNLRITQTPSQGVDVLVSGNSDLWTANAGYNQDLGIFVSDNGGADQLLGWKESGGFAGTYSPNAAYVQTLLSEVSGHTYVFKLKWKTNKPASGTTIYAGAAPSAPFSPTTMTAESWPAGVHPRFAVSNQQYTLTNSNGSTWVPMDAVNLATIVTPAADSVAYLGGNADLWTYNAGVNQDLAIMVSVDGGATQLVGWKESGGYAGTFSPNAAYAQATYSMLGGHSYAFSLAWKANKNVSGTGDKITVGAGPSAPFSPTSLYVATIPVAVAPVAGRSALQYSLTGSNGTTWQLVDPALNVSFTPSTGEHAILGGNADLWTENAGYNQDIAIFVSDNGGADTLVGWKESGGFAGTFSPNAAYVQAVYNMTAGHTYVFKLKWKTNKLATGVTIHSGAAPSAPFSPTTLTLQQAQ